MKLSTSPIVIYGAARSGTTYLVQILNRHPEVYVSDEARVFTWAHQALNLLRGDERDSNRQSDEPGGRRVADRSAFDAHLRRTLPRTLRNYYRTLAPRARWWGDKNPHYADPMHGGCLETTLELFPQARFIHVVRDGRDVVTSGLRGSWTDFSEVHRMWTSHLDVGSAFGRALPPGQYFELRYEELIADDLAMASRLFAFLGIDLDPAVALFCRRQQVERTPFCSPSRDLSRDVRRSEWADFLSPAQQRQSLELIGDHLVRFGYETRESLSAARRALGPAGQPAVPPAVSEAHGR